MARTTDSLEKEREELTPIFASYETTINFHTEHSLLKSGIIELNCLWKNYSEIYKEIRKNPSGNEVLRVSIRDVSYRISSRIRELGESLYKLLDELERVDFYSKYKEFEKTQDQLSETACSLMYINKNSLTNDLVEILGKVEYSLYRSLTLGQAIGKKTSSLETNWIHTKQFEILKYLYKNCKYNLRDYLNVHRIATQNITEQKEILFEMSMAQQMNVDFITNMNNQFMADNLISTHSEIYNELNVEGKIHHHELSIHRRRVGIDRILHYHKRVMDEIDIINWCVGKEAKNIVNMEKTIHGKYDLSMKKLFSLFERSSNKLKEYEITLARYGKLVTSSKRAEPSMNRLFQIKSLDFKYLMIEGDLKKLKEDIELLHSASKEIYSRRSEVFRETPTED